MSIISESEKGSASYSPNFINGVEFLNRGMVKQAHHCFEMAYEQVSYQDFHYNKYASYCGYTRVLKGDPGGLAICREVVRNECEDGDVYFNLAKSEWYYNNRKKTVEALNSGLSVEHGHTGLREFRDDLGVRQKTPIRFLARSHSLNNALGKLLRA